MTGSKALVLAQAYLSQCEIPWVAVRQIIKTREWWFFASRCYDIEIDTGNGRAVVVVSRHYQGGIWSCEHYPSDPTAFLLPPWLAYPHYSSVTIGWRMGPGEEYKYKWHEWYGSLNDVMRAEYQQRFPPPEDETRAWKGYYELVADIPSRGSISDHIIGRV